MKIALFAAGSLFIANIFSVLMVQAEARGRSFIAGITEMAYWLANIVATRYAVTSFHLDLVICCTISAFFSTWLATHIGHKQIDDVTDSRQDNELSELEARLEALEADSKGA